MTEFVTSDLHFFHVNIVEMGWRDFASVEDMNETIIRNFNSLVDDGDTVYILGDTVMGKFKENVSILGELNGNKILVPGNHDRVHPSYDKREWKRDEFRAYYEEYVTIGPLVHDHGKYIMCHFPYDGDHASEVRYPEYRPEDTGRILLHGHMHGEWKMNGRQIDVGVDAWNFYPVPLSDIDALIDQEFWR